MIALSPRLQSLFEHTKTVCFGRFIIDVPATATVVFDSAYVPVQTTRFTGRSEMLAATVAERESALKAEKRYPARSGVTLFEQVVEGVLPDQRIVIGWKDFDSPFYKVESYFKVGPDLYLQESEAMRDGDKEAADIGFSLSKVVEKLNKTALSMRHRADDEVPTDPGVCIDGAFLPSPLDQGVEVIFFGMRLEEFADVHLSIETRKMDGPLGEGQGLEELLDRGRNAAILSGNGLAWARTQFFRRHTRDLHGLHGYEILARKPASGDDSAAHDFRFQYEGEPNNSLKPLIDMHLDTGVQGNATASRTPSLTDEEAIALWDRLTGSIRLRPTKPGPTKTSDAGVMPPTPFGALALTGRACPHTGWWECVEQALPVRGGRRQFFREGEAMPHAVLEAERSLWQTLTGDAPSHTVATVWKRVDGPPRAA